MTENKTIYIISDKSKVLDENNDLLGTRHYADVIFDVLENNEKNIEKGKEEESLRIGLEGCWGAGKSSILDTLENKIANNKKYKYFKFDGWKHSKNSFDKAFLLNFTLNFSKEKEKEKKQVNELFSYKTTNIFSKNTIILFIFLVIFIVLKVTFYNHVSPDWYKYLHVFIDVSIAISAVIFGFSIITYTSEKAVCPEEISKYFKDFTKKYKNKDFVIVIDNIDRTDFEGQKELLKTIKTFFNSNNVVFIVPFRRENLLTENEKPQVNDKLEEQNEFYRKVFNVILFVRRPQDLHLLDYTLELMKSNNLIFYNEEYAQDIAKLISQEFTTNPRRIISFLNDLSCEYLLVKKLEESGQIKEKITTDKRKFLFLVKLKIIREEYGERYENIQKSNDYRSTIQYDFSEAKKKTPYDWFENRTSSIFVEDVKPFLYLLDFKEDADIKKLIMNKDITALVKDSYSVDNVLRALSRKMNDVVNLMDVQCLDEVEVLVELGNHEKFQDAISNTYLDLFKSYVDLLGKESFSEVHSSKLIQLSKYMYDKGIDSLKHKIDSILIEKDTFFSENKYGKTKADFYIDYFQNYELEDMGEVVEGFRHGIQRDNREILKLESLISNEQLIKEILDQRTIDDLIRNLNEIKYHEEKAIVLRLICISLKNTDKKKFELNKSIIENLTNLLIGTSELDTKILNINHKNIYYLLYRTIRLLLPFQTAPLQFHIETISTPIFECHKGAANKKPDLKMEDLKKLEEEMVKFWFEVIKENPDNDGYYRDYLRMGLGFINPEYLWDIKNIRISNQLLKQEVENNFTENTESELFSALINVFKSDKIDIEIRNEISETINMLLMKAKLILPDQIEKIFALYLNNLDNEGKNIKLISKWFRTMFDSCPSSFNSFNEYIKKQDINTQEKALNVVGSILTDSEKTILVNRLVVEDRVHLVGFFEKLIDLISKYSWAKGNLKDPLVFIIENITAYSKKNSNNELFMLSIRKLNELKIKLDEKNTLKIFKDTSWSNNSKIVEQVKGLLIRQKYITGNKVKKTLDDELKKEIESIFIDN